jgi:hypothetical protein
MDPAPSKVSKTYDIVGDIHGHANALHRLLGMLGYSETNDAFSHPERTMLFVGDFIDRGPEQREALRVVRRMCETGSARAVLGNHEFNAIGWVTPDGGDYLREHSKTHKRQHAEFLAQVGEGSDEHHSAVRWFKTLPVWLDLPGLRIVHACWHEPSCRALRQCLDERGCFTEAGLRESFRKRSAAGDAAEILLKGPEEPLPDGIFFCDKDGHGRQEVRVRWWDDSANTFRRAALGMEGREHELPDTELPMLFRYPETKPVFFGHYWLQGKPRLTAPNSASPRADISRATDGWANHLSTNEIWFARPPKLCPGAGQPVDEQLISFEHSNRLRAHLQRQRECLEIRNWTSRMHASTTRPKSAR